MIIVDVIRIQKVNGSIKSKEEIVKNKHTFATIQQMNEWRNKKQLKLQYKANRDYLKKHPGDTEHCPTVYVALTYTEK